MNTHFSSLLKTFISKSSIVLLNFLIVVLSTNLWGAEGRGNISILMSNVAIISIFGNILAGSSISYYTPRLGINKLFLPALAWITIISFFLSLLFFVFQTKQNFIFLFTLAFLNSLVNLYLTLFIGKEKLKAYNFYSLLSPLFLLLIIVIYEYGFHLYSYRAYIFGYMVSQTIVSGLCLVHLKPSFRLNQLSFSIDTISKLFHFGWKNELSYLLQFLNYRLSYFFILYYIDIKSVGLFSVGIAIAESIWVISRSISIVQFAKIVNSTDHKAAIKLTNHSALISLYASIALIVILASMPNSLYGLIFGEQFLNVKEILFILFPGILALSVTNIFGHFFSATKQLNILINKSLLGLIVTVILSVVLIPLWGLKGACWVSTASYLVSAGYMGYKYYYGISSFHLLAKFNRKP